MRGLAKRGESPFELRKGSPKGEITCPHEPAEVVEIVFKIGKLAVEIREWYAHIADWPSLTIVVRQSVNWHRNHGCFR